MIPDYSPCFHPQPRSYKDVYGLFTERSRAIGGIGDLEAGHLTAWAEVDAAMSANVPVAEFCTRKIDPTGQVFVHHEQPMTYRQAFASGWSANLYEHFITLGAYAAATGAHIGLTADSARAPLRPDAADAAHRITIAAEYAVKHGATLPVVLPWLRVLADTADSSATLATWLEEWNAPWLDNPSPIIEWNDRFADLAPLVFAAGLTLDEAVDRQAAGALDESSLRVMAGLRGYHLN